MKRTNIPSAEVTLSAPTVTTCSKMISDDCVIGSQSDSVVIGSPPRKLFHSSRGFSKDLLPPALQQCDNGLITVRNLHIFNLNDERIDDTETEIGKLKVTAFQKYPVVLRWPNPTQEVYVSGSYDDWSTTLQMAKNGDELFVVVEMAEGVHQYKYLVDGEWACHPNEPKVENEVGTQNNIIRIRSCDADIFKVLDADCPDTSERSCSTPPGDYSQYIPPKETAGFIRFGPPLVPPHLFDSMLNTDTPAHLEPLMLPEPLHVVLNHLYTLSIKDGIMVLSSTHRYRKKYITTLLYRPT